MSLLTDLAIGLVLLWTLGLAGSWIVHAWREYRMGMEARVIFVARCDASHDCPSIIGGHDAESLVIADAISSGWSVADGRWTCPSCQKRPGRMTLTPEHSHEIGGEG